MLRRSTVSLSLLLLLAAGSGVNKVGIVDISQK